MPGIIIPVGEIKAAAIASTVVSIIISIIVAIVIRTVVSASGTIVIGIHATVSAVVVSIADAITVLVRAISAIAAKIIAVISPCRLTDYENANNRKRYLMDGIGELHEWD
mgnify:CR=1 FL=1